MPTMLQVDSLTQRQPRARRHGRGKQRGAAMVEAAFMMPMFVILFFTSLYAHNLNAKQISLNIQTRAQAWEYAMYNCGNTSSDEGENLQAVGTGDGLSNINLVGEGGSDSEAAVSGALGSVGGISSIMSGVVGAISSILPNPRGSQSQVEGVVSWRQPNVYTGADPTNKSNVRQTVTVVCNEKAQDGSIGAAVTGIICALTGLAC